MVKRKPLILLLIGAFSSAIILSCSQSNKQDENTSNQDHLEPNSSLNTIFDGKIFSIPSPIQTAYLIKQLDLPFDASLLINASNAAQIGTENKQALILGMYGTDIGYAALYDQKSITLNYLSSIEKLINKLGLDAAFDVNTLAYFNGKHQQDSLILLMSDAYRKTDNILKSADRKATSALILTGGWIESLNIACQLDEVHLNPEIKRRIGEQKPTLNSVIEILKEYNIEEKNTELIDELELLKESFDQVEMKYEYAAAETDAATTLTTFNHKLDIVMDNSVLEEIRSKVAHIRSEIIKV